jgi:hypothetical protein
MTVAKRKKYKRKERLVSAKKWLKNYSGESLIEDYTQWFGTNKVCTIQELEILGYEIDKDLKKQVYRDHERKCRVAKSQPVEKYDEDIFASSQNGDFYFIAGYTSGGAAYGITWEQYENEIKEDHPSEDESDTVNLDDEIPF